MLDLASNGSPECSTSVSFVLVSVTMSLLSTFGGNAKYFERGSCSVMATCSVSGCGSRDVPVGTQLGRVGSLLRLKHAFDA